MSRAFISAARSPRSLPCREMISTLQGIFSNYATEKLLMRGQPYGVLIGNKAGVNAVWSDTIGYNTPVQMNSFRLKADVVGGSEWNNNRNIVLQAVGGDLVIREFGNGWGQILFQDKNISAGGGNVWVTSPDQSELDISVLIDGDTVTVKNNTNDTVLAESTEIRFSTASDGSVNDYSNLFFKFENVTVTDRMMGLLVKEINGEVFRATRSMRIFPNGITGTKRKSPITTVLAQRGRGADLRQGRASRCAAPIRAGRNISILITEKAPYRALTAFPIFASNCTPSRPIRSTGSTLC